MFCVDKFNNEDFRAYVLISTYVLFTLKQKDCGISARKL